METYPVAEERETSSLGEGGRGGGGASSSESPGRLSCSLATCGGGRGGRLSPAR